MTDISLLYVDDEEILRKVTKEYIEHLGHIRVDTASTVPEALKKLKEGVYDAIISDYQMPEIDGIDFLKIVRQQQRDMPFILFSGKSREEVIIEALNSGADFFVQKGGNPRAQFAELMNMVWQAVLRRQSETELARSERRLHDIINFLPDATLVIDRRGKVIAWNLAMEEMTGVPATEMVGKGEYEYAIPFYGKRREMLLDLVMASEDEIAQKSYHRVHREGNGLVAETIEARPRGMNLHLWAKATPLYDHVGNLVGAIETVRDISDIREAENHLQETTKKLSLMSSVTRHDIRNRINGLLAYTDIARATETSAETEHYLSQVTKTAKEILRQIEFARDYQELGANTPLWQNVTGVIARVLEHRESPGIRIEYSLHSLECYADPLFERVFDNLIDNAIRYGDTLTRITFSIEEGNSGIVLTCEDDGIGIPEEYKEQIFERGFGKNTGLGLFLVREILAITNMTIQENGVPGRGARFEIHIPSGRFRFGGNGAPSQDRKEQAVRPDALRSPATDS